MTSSSGSDSYCARVRTKQVVENANWKSQGSLGNIALVLGALTAGGGITGYVRTGSVPSIAAGCTVGLLVRLPFCNWPTYF